MSLTQITSHGIADGAIVNADLHTNAALALSKLNTSGTASSSTFLRGDGAWTAIDLSNLNASNLTSGTVGTARLGSGTASSSTFLRGDGSWQTMSADGGNAATLDSIDSSQFLRSDASDTATGQITFDGGSGVTAGPIITSSNTAGPKLSINSTASGGKHWMIISNGSGNTDGAGYLQLWNSTDSFSPVTFGATSGTATEFRTGIEINNNTVWNAGNDGAGSGLDADTCDGQHLGSSATPLFAEVYSNGWFRNNDTGEGLYNTANNAHFYSPGAKYWHINPSASQANGGLIFYSGYNGTHGDGTGRQGYVYWDTNGFGLLHSGGNWIIRGNSSNTDLYGNLRQGGSNTIWHAGNDGSGSGLDADTLDGSEATKFFSSYDRTTTTGWEDNNRNFRVNTGTAGAAGIAMHDSAGTFQLQLYGASANSEYGFLTANWGSWDIRKVIGGALYVNSASQVWHQGNDGAGSGLDADTLDGVQGASYLRSDAGDSFTGGTLTIAGGNDIRFSNGGWSGDSTKIQHHSNWLYLIGGSNGFIFRHTDGANRWQLNSSGHLFPSTNTTYDLGTSSYKINNGYFNWLYTDSGDHTSTKPTRFYASNDGWIRYYNMLYMRMWLGLSSRDGNDARRDHTSDSDYWVGASGWGTISMNNLMGRGNVFWDTWSNPSGQPSGTSHWNGFNCLHYTNRGSSGTSNGGAYGWQMTMGAGTPSLLYVRGNWSSANLGTPTWYKVWNESNDGSGSGLDADTVDGYEGSRLVINNTANTVTGAPWELNNSGTSGWGFRFYNSTGSNNYAYFCHGTHGLHLRNDSAGTGNYLLEVMQSGAETFLVRGGDGLVTSGGNTMWHAGNDGPGSGLDADTCDGQGLGTGANVTFANIYATSWHRNNDSGDGLYNDGTTSYWYSDHDDVFNIAGGSSANWVRFRDEHAGTIRGYVGANNSNVIGFLDYEGNFAFSSGKFTNYSHRDLCSQPDDGHDLGYGNRRWDNVYATNGTIQTSDRNEKENIVATDLGLAFVNKLSPVSFKRKGKTRTHYGFIAQDIEQIITDLGKTTTQFAPLIKSDISEAKDGSEYRYGLRYEQLLAPVVKAIQELAVKVAALESA